MICPPAALQHHSHPRRFPWLSLPCHTSGIPNHRAFVLAVFPSLDSFPYWQVQAQVKTTEMPRVKKLGRHSLSSANLPLNETETKCPPTFHQLGHSLASHPTQNCFADVVFLIHGVLA